MPSMRTASTDNLCWVVGAQSAQTAMGNFFQCARQAFCPRYCNYLTVQPPTVRQPAAGFGLYLAERPSYDTNSVQYRTDGWLWSR